MKSAVHDHVSNNSHLHSKCFSSNIHFCLQLLSSIPAVILYVVKIHRLPHPICPSMPRQNLSTPNHHQSHRNGHLHDHPHQIQNVQTNSPKSLQIRNQSLVRSPFTLPSPQLTLPVGTTSTPPNSPTTPPTPKTKAPSGSTTPTPNPKPSPSSTPYLPPPKTTPTSPKTLPPFLKKLLPFST